MSHRVVERNVYTSFDRLPADDELCCVLDWFLCLEIVCEIQIRGVNVTGLLCVNAC